MSNPNSQITKKDQQTDLRAVLSGPQMKQRFADVLPKHLSAERYVRVALAAVSRTPKLLDCTQESLMRCLIDLSAFGLEPDGRRAHLIPYGNQCTLIIDWKGLAELALRSGMIAKLHADLVCENDEFEFNLGEVVKHRINFKEPRGAPYAAYAMAQTKDGAAFVAVLTRDEILSVRNGSQGWTAFQKGWAKQSPWDPKNPVSEGEMWKKTAFRRLSKWLPLSAEFRDAQERDDEEERQERDVTPATASPLFQAQPPALPAEPQRENPPEDMDVWTQLRALMLRDNIQWGQVCAVMAENGIEITAPDVEDANEGDIKAAISGWNHIVSAVNGKGGK